MVRAFDQLEGQGFLCPMLMKTENNIFLIISYMFSVLNIMKSSVYDNDIT